MVHYGIPEMFIAIIKNTYRPTVMQSIILHDGHLTGPFDITKEVRQDRMQLPFLFILAVYWIIQHISLKKKLLRLASSPIQTKTEVLKASTKSQVSLKVKSAPLEEVDSFTILEVLWTVKAALNNIG